MNAAANAFFTHEGMQQLQLVLEEDWKLYLHRDLSSLNAAARVQPLSHMK